MTETKTGASYLVKLTLSKPSQTIRVPNGDYRFSGTVDKYSRFSHLQTIPLRDNKATLIVYLDRLGRGDLIRLRLEEYVNIHSGAPEHSEIVVRNDDTEDRQTRIAISIGKLPVRLVELEFYDFKTAKLGGEPRTIKLLDGDYVIRVEYSAPELPSSSDMKRDFIEVTLLGERLTIVADDTSGQSHRDVLSAASSVRIESKSLIVTDGAVRRLDNATLAMFARYDEVIAVLYEDLSGRINPGLKLAMLPMNSSQGIDRDTADYLTENLTIVFFNSNKYDVFERQRVDAILAEQNFQMSGNVDNTTAVQAGKLLGVDAILVANVEGSGDSRRMVLRALDVGTGRILGMTLEQF